jgi:hypothetical protein
MASELIRTDRVIVEAHALSLDSFVAVVGGKCIACNRTVTIPSKKRFYNCGTHLRGLLLCVKCGAAIERGNVQPSALDYDGVPMYGAREILLGRGIRPDKVDEMIIDAQVEQYVACEVGRSIEVRGGTIK